MSPIANNRLSLAGSFVLALALGGLGGWLFWVLHSPLPWLLGAMLACALASLAGIPIRTPSSARPPMTALVGTVIGSSFGPDTFTRASEWIVPLAILLAFLVMGGFCGYIVLRRIGRYDQPTAFFAGMPGGLIEMVTLGKDYGGDERLIAMAHAARIFLVVLSLPFLLQFATGQPIPRASGATVPLASVTLEQGAWFVATYLLGLAFGRLVKLPARYMFAPLIVSSTVHLSGLSDFNLPAALVAMAQVIIGAVIGCRFAGLERRAITKSMALSVVATMALLTITFAFAGIAAKVTGLPFVNLVLSYSPGGLAEMSLIALALSGEAAFVLAHHMIRVALVVATAPVFFKFLLGKPPSGT